MLAARLRILVSRFVINIDLKDNSFEEYNYYIITRELLSTGKYLGFVFEF